MGSLVGQHEIDRPDAGPPLVHLRAGGAHRGGGLHVTLCATLGAINSDASSEHGMNQPPESEVERRPLRSAAP